MKSIGSIIKENLVLFLAVAAALASMTAVPPSAAYAGYINMPVLAILFCLMVVIGGVRESGVFSAVLARLLLRLGTMRQLAAVLVFACFFVSMWVTNDVALLTFVPFSLMALPKVASEEQMALVIVLQTLAANLGSMCTPVGNPQNLYLYFYYAMDLPSFLTLLLPYTLYPGVFPAAYAVPVPLAGDADSHFRAASGTADTKSACIGSVAAALDFGRDVFPFPARRGACARLSPGPGLCRGRHGIDAATVFPLCRLPASGNLCGLFYPRRQYEPAAWLPGPVDGIPGRP